MRREYQWQTVFLSKAQDESKWCPSLLCSLEQRTHTLLCISAHVSTSGLWAPLLATAPYQYLHMKAAEFLMRTTALNQCQHPRGVGVAYTWNLSQKGVDSRNSMWTNRIYQSLARSPGPCSFDSSHTGFHPQWHLSICQGEKALVPIKPQYH